VRVTVLWTNNKRRLRTIQLNNLMAQR
jgi:hypothetical protein